MDRVRLRAELRQLDSLPTLPWIAVKVMEAALSEDSSPEDVATRGELQIIEKSALDGAETVKKIQRFIKWDASGEFTRVDMNEVVGDVLQMAENRCREESIGGGRILIETHLGDLPPVRGNKAELREAFTNIILNAIDAMPVAASSQSQLVPTPDQSSSKWAIRARG